MVSGLLASNSAAKAWCASTGTERLNDAQRTAAPDNTRRLISLLPCVEHNTLIRRAHGGSNEGPRPVSRARGSARDRGACALGTVACAPVGHRAEECQGRAGHGR